MSKLRRAFHALVLVLGAAVAALGQAAPSPEEIERRATSILERMTVEEKIDLLGGFDGFFVRELPRLGLPRLRMADGPFGVRNFGPATTMAGGIGLAATWNPDLAERVGTEIGRDARAKGVHFLLGPAVNIYRAPLNGRNFEYLGEDPLLAARIAVSYVKGVQSQGVSATIKHYAGNNSEFDRHNVDAVIDERALREIYLPAFEAAVKEAHVGAIMDAYNLTNGAHMTQNGRLNTEIAKREWGFDGIMMSDWTSTYDAVAAANGGLDLEMPSARFLNREKLLPALERHEVSVATIDDKVRRILRTAIRFGWLDRDQADLSIPRYNPQGRRVALEAAREAIVLLKNEGGLLPLERSRIKSVAVIGPDAYPAVPVGGGSAAVAPFAAVSFLEGVSQALGGSVNVTWHRGVPSLAEMADATGFVTAETGGERGLRAEYFDNRDLSGSPVLTRVDEHVRFGRPGKGFPDNTQSERWTGYLIPERAGTFDMFVATTGEDGGSCRAFLDGTLILDNWGSARALAPFATVTLDARPHKVVLEHRGRSKHSTDRLAFGFAGHGEAVAPEARALAARADAVIVAVGYDPETEREGADRTFRLPPGQDELIRNMAAANPTTIVVLTSGGGVDTTGWLDRVPVLLEAWYPGQEGGTALAEILLGDENPSGRLPATFERRFEDNPVYDSYYPDAANRVVYKEGVFVGYRGYEQRGIKPLFPFGYGLSYTTFKYANLSVAPAPAPTAGAASAGPRYEVAFDVTNTGARGGADVAQVYLAKPKVRLPQPPKELVGFAKLRLAPGETRRVTVTLDARSLCSYDVAAHQWRAEAGRYEVLVGRSSETIELTGALALATRIALR